MTLNTQLHYITTMVNTCSVVFCKTGYRKRKNKVDAIPENHPVFSFPVKKTEIFSSWVRFVNRKDWKPTKNSGICAKHFEERYLKTGVRTTLRWELNPIPSIYPDIHNVPPSILPSTTTKRKSPTRRTSTLPDQLDEFKQQDQIKQFSEIDASFCPGPAYQLQLFKDKAVFYKTDNCSIYDIPMITETIVITDSLNVKLFFKGIPVPLPEWFRKGSNCCLKSKSMLENFPPYLRSFAEKSTNDVQDELQRLKYKKPDNGPKYSTQLLQFALLLRYTSLPAYKLLKEFFPIPSLSLLSKLSKGGIAPLKAAKVLLDKEKISKDVVLLVDEMYLQKSLQYQDGKIYGSDEDGNLFKGIMTFMIVGLRKNIPFVIKAVPESKIDGKWISSNIEESIKSLHEIGFQVRAVISDNHPSNIAAFRDLCQKFGIVTHENAISLLSKSNSTPIYLFYDSVHLLKNIRNNLLNSKRFIFPPFAFDQFYDEINVPGGEISWRLLHEVYDQDQTLQANLRKANKLTYRALHPGDNKQSVPLALSIFDPTTSAAIVSYCPERNDAAFFLKLINLWWTISNSKQQFNSNYRIGNAACLNDKKPQFLRNLAKWIQDWRSEQCSNSEKFTLSKQTSDAFVVTLRCTASLIEDLLREGYSYVLTARLQTDSLELRFSKYRQMSGGRFLVALREVTISERILATKSLLKESISIWDEDVRPNPNEASAIPDLQQELDKFAGQLESCTLEDSSREVSCVVAGYIAKKLLKKLRCTECEHSLTISDPQFYEKDFDYLFKLSRGGLTLPSVDLSHYVAKAFAMLETALGFIMKTDLTERHAAEAILTRNTCSQSFLCERHVSSIKVINRIICNIYFNNAQKLAANEVRRDAVQQFKHRRKRQRNND